MHATSDVSPTNGTYSQVIIKRFCSISLSNHIEVSRDITEISPTEKLKPITVVWYSQEVTQLIKLRPALLQMMSQPQTATSGSDNLFSIRKHPSPKAQKYLLRWTPCICDDQKNHAYVMDLQVYVYVNSGIN